MKVNWTASKKYRPSPLAEQLYTEEEEDDRLANTVTDETLESIQDGINHASTRAEAGDFAEALRLFQIASQHLLRAAEGTHNLEDKIETMQGKVAEMMAQILNEMGRYFAAVQQAEMCVAFLPSWSVGYQTLGRAQFNLGDFIYAEKSFERALFLDPGLEEIKTFDLPLTSKLALEQSHKLANNSKKSDDKIS